jgi:hypothetical protein
MLDGNGLQVETMINSSKTSQARPATHPFRA